MGAQFYATRLDENPTNVTFGKWVVAGTFHTREEAEAYVQRAQGPTQKLRVEGPERYGGKA